MLAFSSIFFCLPCFPPCSADMANLTLNDNDGSSGASDQDTLAPLPLPGASPWPMMHSFQYQYPQPAYSSQPPPYHELTSYSYAPGSTGSQHSEGTRPFQMITCTTSQIHSVVNRLC